MQTKSPAKNAFLPGFHPAAEFEKFPVYWPARLRVSTEQDSKSQPDHYFLNSLLTQTCFHSLRKEFSQSKPSKSPNSCALSWAKKTHKCKVLWQSYMWHTAHIREQKSLGGQLDLASIRGGEYTCGKNDRQLTERRSTLPSCHNFSQLHSAKRADLIKVGFVYWNELQFRHSFGFLSSTPDFPDRFTAASGNSPSCRFCFSVDWWWTLKWMRCRKSVNQR